MGFISAWCGRASLQWSEVRHVAGGGLSRTCGARARWRPPDFSTGQTTLVGREHFQPKKTASGLGFSAGGLFSPSGDPRSLNPSGHVLGSELEYAIWRYFYQLLLTPSSIPVQQHFICVCFYSFKMRVLFSKRTINPSSGQFTLFFLCSHFHEESYIEFSLCYLSFLV